MSFHLNAKSVFRFYVPQHNILDVDLYLYSGTPVRKHLLPGYCHPAKWSCER